jgi:Tol biopolymer transport system component
MNGDGTDQTALTGSGSFPTGAHHPALSPNGKLVAFVYEGNIYVRSTTSGRFVTQLTNTIQVDMELSWSPDGQKIVFSRRVGSGIHQNYEIFWVTLDGLTEQQVTNNFGIDARDPVWNPDGQSIAFERSDGMYEVDADCLNCTGGFFLLAGARDLAFSPDGSQIVYVWRLAYGVDYELWIADYGVPGSETQVTWDTAVEGNPTWSPDGNRIAFDTDRSSVGWPTRDVWMLRLSDMRPAPLTRAGGDVRPTWALVPTPGVITRP